MSPSTRAQGAAIAIVLVAAAGLRCWGISFGLPLTQARPDESRIVNLATRIAAGDLNPHYFVYPTLYMYLLAALFKAQAIVQSTTEMTYERLLLTGRLVTAAFGSATVLLVYLLGRRIADAFTGLIAAAILAVAFLHVRDSHFATTDVPMTCMAVAAVLLLLRPRQRAAQLALSGVVAGLAVSLKYSAALVAVVAVFVEGYSAWKGERTKTALAARLTIVLVAMLCGFLLGTPYALLDRETFRSGVAFVSTYLQAGHQYGGQALGVSHAPWHYLTVVLPAAVGWPALVAGLAGLLLLAAADARAGIACLLFPVVYFATAGRGQTVFARYMIPVVPFVCLGAGYFVRRIAAIPGRQAAAVAVGTGLILAIGAPVTVRTIQLDRLLSTLDNRLVARHWIDERLRQPVCETGSLYGRVHSENEATHCLDPDAADPLPPYVVVQRSPLTLYSGILPAEEHALASQYVLIQTFNTGASALRESDYDPSDAFFIPLKRLAEVRRPGPEFEVYERRGR